MSELRAFLPFRPSEIAGAIVVQVFAVISTLTLAAVACRVLWLVARHFLQRIDDQPSPRELVFFRTQLGHYAACLLLANMCLAMAGLMSSSWLLQKGIFQDGLCSAQAILMQFGNFSTAYFTLTVAVHTFNSLVLRKRQSALISVTTVVMGWAGSGVIAALSFARPQPSGPMYGGSDLFCGIRRAYPKPQFLFHLLPILIASVLSAVLCALIFLVIRGTLAIKGGLKLTLDPNERWSGHADEDYHRFMVRIAKSMLWYPIAYTTLFVPYSITKLLDLSGFRVPFPAIVFAYTCWFMLGIVNVLLLYNTFRVLGPAFDAPTSTQKAMESFSTPEAFIRFTNSNFVGSPPLTDEKIIHYLNPSLADSMGEATSVHALISDEVGQADSSQSFYSYSSTPSIDHVIAPASDLNRVPLEPVPQKFSRDMLPAVDRSHQLVSDSFSLPAPPRPSHASISRRLTAENHLSETTQGNITLDNRELQSSGRVTPVSRYHSTQSTASRQSKDANDSFPSWSLEVFDDLGWSGQQSSDGSAHEINSRPVVSTTSSSFASPAMTYSMQHLPVMHQDSDSTPGRAVANVAFPPQHGRSRTKYTVGPPRHLRSGRVSVEGEMMARVSSNLSQ